ncbi:MAG TPA: alpha/beta hydrolase [Candidatus Limnocylindrales bacterium]|nr:alpha/beta hydrolase [Candidatus Limnocylindrales bacterium]
MTAATAAPTVNGTVSPSISAAQMADGTNLRVLHWPPVGDPWAVAEIVHGLGEHGGRYDNVAEALTGAGIDTWAYDHRGNGGSGGPRVFVERWPILHDDLEARLTSLHEAAPDRPLILYGHSLGGLVACGYVLSGQDRLLPDALVLSAPGLEANLPGWQKSLAGVLTGIVPKLKIANGLPDGGLSRDPAVGAKADADPMCSTKSSVRWAAEAFAEQDRLRALLPGLASMPVPTYVLHGAADPIVPVRATDVFEGKGNVTRRVHEGLRHEQHHEPEHEAVLAEVVAWLEATLKTVVQAPAG